MKKNEERVHELLRQNAALNAQDGIDVIHEEKERIRLAQVEIFEEIKTLDPELFAVMFPVSENETHYLKTIQPYFNDIKSGVKAFEFRKNDRNYRVGDIVYLQKYDAKTKKYSGDQVIGEITYILKDISGLDPEYCVFGFINYEAKE